MAEATALPFPGGVFDAVACNGASDVFASTAALGFIEASAAMVPIAEVGRVGCSGAPMMQPELTSRNLIAQLRILQTDYEALRASAHEIEARGYRALLASTAFAGQAYELRDRAVELFSRLAHVFQPIEEARNIRLRLLQVSEHLASLFDENSVPERLWSGRNFGAQLTGPTIKDILYAIDKQSTVHGGISLHDQMLSIANAASGALHTWQPFLDDAD